MAAGRQVDSAVADAVDSLLQGGVTALPMQAEVLEPLIEAGGQVARLRDGLFGPLTVEQRQALNVVHGRLSHIALLLSEMHEGTALAPKGVEALLTTAD